MKTAKSIGVLVVMVVMVVVVTVLVAGPAEAGKRKGKGKGGTVTFWNESSWDIYELYLSPSHESTWGPDQLGRDVLESGESLTLTGIGCGDWDVRVVDEDGDECVLQGVHLCGTEGWEITDDELLTCMGVAADSSLTLVNDSSWEIHRIYLSPSSSRRWGPDQLGQEILYPGEYLALNDLDCDTYDLMLVDEDGDECVLEDIDLCAEEAGWHITDRTLLACQADS